MCDEKKLLSCPFCGGKLVVANDRMAIHPMGDCFLSNTAFHMRDSWIRRWNTRKPMKRIVEWLEDVKLLALQNACLKEAGPECYDISCETCYMNRAIEIVKEEGGIE